MLSERLLQAKLIVEAGDQYTEIQWFLKKSIAGCAGF
jgi:hypothetical protein